MFVFVLVSKRYKVYKQHQSIETFGLFSSHAGSVALVIMSHSQSQVVLLQTAHYWANAGVLLGARMHRERGSFRSN